MKTSRSRIGLPTTRLLGPQTCRRLLLSAKILIVLAASIAILSTQNLNAISLSLFLVVEQACIIIGVFLYVLVAITKAKQ